MKNVQVKKLTKGTNTLSREGYEKVSSAVNQIMGIGVMVCPSYTFVVGKFLQELFITENHVIPNHLGGSDFILKHGAFSPMAFVSLGIKWCQNRQPS